MTPTSPHRTVLIVDDDDELRTQLVRSMQRRNLEASGASNADEAIQHALRRKHDLYVVDLRLGEDSGLDLIGQLARLHPSATIVVLTGYGSIATALRAVRLGAHNFITKPADADEILAAAVMPADVEHDARRAPAPDYETPSLARAEWEHIQRVLADCGGNISQAADKLGIHRRSLQRKLQRPPED